MSQAQILFEFDVVEATAKYLFSKNFRVQQRLMPTQKGIDIIATRNVPNELTVYIEAKGATSSRKSSARFSKPFDSAQVKIHIAEAYYTATNLILDNSLSNNRIVGIALPDTELHRRYEGRIHKALLYLGIGIFWAQDDHKVMLEAPWEL